jgi:hypothetical protein
MKKKGTWPVVLAMGLLLSGIFPSLDVLMAGKALARVTETPSKKEPLKRESEKLIWAGESGGFAIRWTTADLQAQSLKRPGQIAFSAAALAKQGFDRYLPLAREIIQEGWLSLLTEAGSSIFYQS